MSRSPPPDRRRRRGSIAVEFTLVAPILAMLGLAVLDVVDFLRISLRIERTAGEVANIVAQYEVLPEAEFATLFDLAGRIADPWRVTQDDGAVILTGLANQGQGTVVLWQRRAGSSGYPSAFGAEGGVATIPARSGDLVLASGQGAVVTEVFLAREPWILSGRFVPGDPFTRLQSFALQRPRMVSILRVSAP
ncbi:TadE/TadG family type IV pilus assembly protein [Roseomonas sp. HF4]|uniref:TadE/TadG family type IV pilus assembly protein n=1 Tax=Roseomonas sp. HF4 TaxID=2562313 RepID=UPI0010BFAC13|nr:TadE/TadG family type IV pilus assembly protein [Roseomonas sp. HF4]